MLPALCHPPHAVSARTRESRFAAQLIGTYREAPPAWLHEACGCCWYVATAMACMVCITCASRTGYPLLVWSTRHVRRSKATATMSRMHYYSTLCGARRMRRWSQKACKCMQTFIYHMGCNLPQWGWHELIVPHAYAVAQPRIFGDRWAYDLGAAVGGRGGKGA